MHLKLFNSLIYTIILNIVLLCSFALTATANPRSLHLNRDQMSSSLGNYFAAIKHEGPFEYDYLITALIEAKIELADIKKLDHSFVWTDLMASIEINDEAKFETTKKLINSLPKRKREFYLDYISPHGIAAIHYPVTLLRKEEEQYIKELCKLGANPNLQTANGDSALILAISEEKNRIAKVLIEDCHADVNLVQAKSLLSPLMISAYYANFELFQLLLNNKANLHSADAQGKTALRWARQALMQEVMSKNSDPKKMNQIDKIIHLIEKNGLQKLLVGKKGEVLMAASSGAASFPKILPNNPNKLNPNDREKIFQAISVEEVKLKSIEKQALALAMQKCKLISYKNCKAGKFKRTIQERTQQIGKELYIYYKAAEVSATVLASE